MSSDKHSVVQAKGFLSEFASGVLEKVWDINWCLKACYVALYADIALVLLTRGGLYDLSLAPAVAWGNVGKILCVMLMLLVFSSLFVPMIVHVIRTVHDSAEKYDGGEMTPGNVSISKFRKLALSENSNFLLELCDRHDRSAKEVALKKSQACSLFVGLFILVPFNFFIGMARDVSVITRLTESNFDYVVTALSILALCYAIGWSLEKDHRRHWVYYPPLYEQNLKKKRDDEKREQDERRKYREEY